MVGVVLMALDAATGPLAAHRWRHRVVVVHDAGQEANWLGNQVDALRASRAANVDRDIVVWVCRNGNCAIDEAAGIHPGVKIDPHALARTLGVKTPTVFLIGKDGQVKVRSHGMVAPAELHQTIDAMPMRQAEAARGS